MAGKKKNGFISQSFARRLNSMLAVDSRRMFTAPLLYVLAGIALVMPILILVMTTMTAGSTVVDPNTGVETTREAFSSVWQDIASESGAGSSGGMDMSSMCNINLMYFMTGVFVCLFTAEDFRSGYAKNLFTVRARKGDYVVSKTVMGFLAGAIFLICFFLGTLLGGAFAGLPFALGAAGFFGVVMCMLAKIFLMAVFVAIFLLMSVFAKQRSWLSICLSLFGGMLLFMMVPMLTPLDSGIGNVGMCLIGGVLFAAALGVLSKMLLAKQDLV
ncbi:MAG: ABC transporter permease [Oscillospiraceae bacterium]|nr:ABC transporter permease [Oscillospiraceae bacterium]